MQIVSPPTFSQAAAQVRAHNASKVGFEIGYCVRPLGLRKGELQARSVGRNLSLVPYVSGLINGQPGANRIST